MKFGCPFSQALPRSQPATRRGKNRHGTAVARKAIALAKWNCESLMVLTIIQRTAGSYIEAMRFIPEAPHAETVIRLWAQWSTLKNWPTWGGFFVATLGWCETASF